MVKRFKYSGDHLLYLEIGYQLMNAGDLARAFNQMFKLKQTEGQIKAALSNHHITCGRKGKDRLVTKRLRIYTSKQADFLRNNYKGRSIAELTEIFNKRFGKAMTKQQIKSFVHNRGIVSGRTGYFPKGHKPWNAGTKGKGLTGANKTSFKKGHRPANRKPIGATRICSKDGYVLIKIAEKDPYTGFPTRYKLKHIHVWEQAHGPIPDGMVVIFRDGNKLNIDIENLMLVSRHELLRLNKHGYKDAPDKLKPSVLALAKLEVKTFSVIKDATQ